MKLLYIYIILYSSSHTINLKIIKDQILCQIESRYEIDSGKV